MVPPNGFDVTNSDKGSQGEGQEELEKGIVSSGRLYEIQTE